MFSIFTRGPKKYTDVDVAEFAQLKDQQDHVVIDVRSPGELAEGSIPGHQMINFFDNTFKDKLSKLDKAKTYLVYCRSGNRSGQACTVMANMGFEKLYNLQGGIMAWNRTQG